MMASSSSSSSNGASSSEDPLLQDPPPPPLLHHHDDDPLFLLLLLDPPIQPPPLLLQVHENSGGGPQHLHHSKDPDAAACSINVALPLRRRQRSPLVMVSSGGGGSDNSRTHRTRVKKSNNRILRSSSSSSSQKRRTSSSSSSSPSVQSCNYCVQKSPPPHHNSREDDKSVVVVPPPPSPQFSLFFFFYFMRWWCSSPSLRHKPQQPLTVILFIVGLLLLHPTGTVTAAAAVAAAVTSTSSTSSSSGSSSSSSTAPLLLLHHPRNSDASSSSSPPPLPPLPNPHPLMLKSASVVVPNSRSSSSTTTITNGSSSSEVPPPPPHYSRPASSSAIRRVLLQSTTSDNSKTNSNANLNKVNLGSSSNNNRESALTRLRNKLREEKQQQQQLVNRSSPSSSSPPPPQTRRRLPVPPPPLQLPPLSPSSPSSAADAFYWSRSSTESKDNNNADMFLVDGVAGGGVSDPGMMMMNATSRLLLLPTRVNRNIHQHTRQLISYGIGSGGTTDIQRSKDSIHIAGFFPTSSLANISSEGAIGRGVLPAVKLAIYHINIDNRTLPDYKLHISWNDTKCSASDGMKAFFDMMHEAPLKYMLFGDACTQVTDPIAKASRYWKVAQLSYADMHPMFSKKNYPNLFRIVPSENEFNAPRLALLKKYNWTRVGTLYQNKPRYSLAHNKLVSDLETMGVDVVAAQSFGDDITYHIHKLKEKDVRIILGNFNETWARRIFCEAYREKLYGRKYQWLIVAAYTPAWWRKQDDVNCTVEQVETALKGALLMDLLPLSTSSNITIAGITAEKYNEMYQVVKLNEYSRFHGYAYDGIWAIALALHNMSRFYPDPQHSHTKSLLRTFQYHNDNWQTAFLRALEATSFTGVTGKVEFRDNGRKGTILIKQFRAFNTVNAEVKVGEFDGVAQTLSLFTTKDNEIVWNGRNPPKDRTIEIIEHTRVNPTLFATMTIASSVGIVLACFFLAINIKFRNQRYIKMSSPYLNNLIIIGCIFTYTSVIILGLDSKLTSVEAFPYICTARAWILMAGFTLAFGSMFSKTWRVHSIFTNVKLNKKVIKDMQLFIVVGILLAIDFAIMTTWHFLDPMHRSTKRLEAYTNPSNDDIYIIPENEYCKSQYMNYFVGSIYAYKGLLMLFGCFLAWETRNVSIPALNDSKYIGMSVYNSVMMCVLGAPLSHVLTDKHDASFFIISLFIIFCTTATLCLVFLPKIIELKRNPKGTVEKRLRTTIKPPSQTRRPSATSMYEAELKTAKQENQKIRKQIREVDNEIQALAKILGDDAQDILHDAMHNLALPKSEVLKKEDTDVSSLYSLNSDGGEDVFIEDATEGANTPKKKYPGLATALAAAAGNLSTTTTAPWEQQNPANGNSPATVVVAAKTILINSSGSAAVKSEDTIVQTSSTNGGTTTAPIPISQQQSSPPQPPLSNSPSEEPVTIEEKSLPKIPEETVAVVSPTAEQQAAIQQQQQQQQQQRQQRSLSVVIMQPIQLLPKYLRLNKSDLDLTESCCEQQQQEHMIVTTTSGSGFPAPGRRQDGLVVKDLQHHRGSCGGTPSTTTQQEIWTMLQKDRRYMDRNIYVGEEDEEAVEEEEEDDDLLVGDEDMDEEGDVEEGEIVVDSSSSTSTSKNKRLKSPTVAKPISLLLAEGGGGVGMGDRHHGSGGLRLQLPKKKRNKTDEDGNELTDEDEFINGSSHHHHAHGATSSAADLRAKQQQQQHQHHRRLSMQPHHTKSGQAAQGSSQGLTPSIRTLSSSTTTLTTGGGGGSAPHHHHQQQHHAYSSSSHFPLFSGGGSSSSTSAYTHDPNTYSQTLTTSSSTRPIPSSRSQLHHPHRHHQIPVSGGYPQQHASTEEINRGGVHHHPATSSSIVPMISNNLTAKSRSYSVPRRLDNSQLNLSEINLDVSLLPIFHKILSERSRSLREGSTSSRGGGGVHRNAPGGGSGGDLHTRGTSSTTTAGSSSTTGAPLRRNKRGNNLMLSCPNIMIKCDIVEYL